METTTSINDTFISKNTIREIYESHCEEMEIPFDEKEFQNFLDFLAIDINDWVDGNLRYFYIKK